MHNRLDSRKAALARALLTRNLIPDEAPIVGVLDFDALRSAVTSLKEAFPRHFRHAFAAKANSMPGVLSFIRNSDMACEVASRPEFAAALGANFAPQDIIFDSPAKTVHELRHALEVGATLYVDNFQELDRLANLPRVTTTASTIGIRINPQVGAGSIADTSTASATSKFGIALRDAGNREKLVAAFVRWPWLTALHVHVGSQGCPLELSIEGVRAVVDLALDIDRACGHQRISQLDIGGGLPVNFLDDTTKPTFEDYAVLLHASVPELFSGSYTVVTEFGRSLISKCGFIVARVEYTKVMGGRHIALTHAGAQVAARTVYQPEIWPLRISALDACARPKYENMVEQDIAGPCCFAGDILAHQRPLPLLEPGDHVLIHDTGGYYFSSPYIYNSLPPIDAFSAVGRSHEVDFARLATSLSR